MARPPYASHLLVYDVGLHLAACLRFATFPIRTLFQGSFHPYVMIWGHCCISRGCPGVPNRSILGHGEELLLSVIGLRLSTSYSIAKHACNSCSGEKPAAQFFSESCVSVRDLQIGHKVDCVRRKTTKVLHLRSDCFDDSKKRGQISSHKKQFLTTQTPLI